MHRGESDAQRRAQPVAVKVLRPNVASRFRRDLGDFFFVAHKAEAHSAEARRLRLVEVINTMSRSVAMEMDLRLEAAALSEMAENTRDDPDFRVPTVDWDRTTHNVLTMEWIDGIALNDHARLAQSHVDLPGLGRKVIQSFLRHALRDGFFHADMHPGNLFLDDTGRLVAVDFGIMGRLGQKERRFLAEILLGFITRDYRRVAEVHFEAGYVPGHHSVENFAQAIRAIGEPIHNRTAEEISMAKLLTLLLEVTGLFDMQTRPELILLQKTMVVVEGVARGFDPKLDIWKVADPVVREWIERNLGPVGRIQGAMSGAGELGRVLAQSAGIASRAVAVLENLEKMSREGVTLSQESDCGDGPERGPQEPLAYRRAVDHCYDVHRDPDRHPPIVIAMQSWCASIAIICRRRAMASLTIRKLDDAIKAYLRLRSAKNGRSVEEEVRVILREYLEGRPGARRVPSTVASRGSSARSAGCRRHRRAPRHPDHRRRHRRLQGAGSDPAAEGAAHPCPLRADQGGAAIRHAAGGQRPVA